MVVFGYSCDFRKGKSLEKSSKPLDLNWNRAPIRIPAFCKHWRNRKRKHVRHGWRTEYVSVVEQLFLNCCGVGRICHSR